MEITQIHTLNFTGILTQSKRIILTKHTHFITFSLLFLPLSFSLIITPTLNRHLSDQPYTFDNSNNHQKLITSYLIYTLIVHVIALCAIATITFTTHHTFFNNPVNVLDSLKSLIFSFIPLAFTAIVAYVLLVLIIMIYLLFVVILLVLVNNLWFVIQYNSVYSVWFSAFMAAVMIAIILYFSLNWSLAFVVVVVESKWGFGALKRSSYLVKGMRLVLFLMVLCFGGFGAFIVWIYSLCHDVMALMTIGSFVLMMVLVLITTASTVLYNYCKVLHGELVIEGFDDHEYVSLPLDDEKVQQVVTA